MESIVYNQEGTETGKVTLPESVFGVKWNPDLVHQVVTSMRGNARSGTAHTKNRGEVRGGGRKPWRQKGTGRARHGSIRSPLWVGGGVTHGPRSEKKYTRKINKKMKRQALFSVLSRKLHDGEVVFLQGLSVIGGKAREAKHTLHALSVIKALAALQKKKHNAAFVVLPRKEKMVERGFRNFGNIAVGEARNVNVLDALKYKYLILVAPEESIKFLTRSV